MDDGQISAQIGNEEICLIRLSISLCVNSPHSKTQIKVENRPWGGFLLYSIRFPFCVACARLEPRVGGEKTIFKRVFSFSHTEAKPKLTQKNISNNLDIL